MFGINSNGSIVEHPDLSMIVDDTVRNQVMATLIDKLPTVDTQALKQQIVDADNAIMTACAKRTEALITISAIKADVPDFDDSPLQPDDEDRVKTLLAA